MGICTHDGTDMSGEYDTELEIDRRYAEQASKYMYNRPAYSDNTTHVLAPPIQLAVWAPAYWRELNSSITCLNDYSLRYKDYEKGADTGCRTCVLVP